MDELFLAEMLPGALIDIVRRTAPGNQRDRFSPLKRGPFAICEERRHAKGIQRIGAPLIREAIDPRSPRLNQM